MKTNLFALFILFTAVFPACDVYETEEYEPYYVVEAYLAGNEPLSEVRLSTTSPLSGQYSFDANAVSNAAVTVSLMQVSNPEAVEQTFTYTQEKPGIYKPAAGVTHKVIPTRTYKLDISSLNKTEIAATRIVGYTQIPDSVHIVRLGFESQANRPPFVPGSSIDATYQQQDQLLIDINVGEFTDNRTQNFYIFTIRALDTLRQNLTPFYAAVLEEDEIEWAYVNSSGIVNQENYQLNTDNTVSIKFPWIGIAFYGRNTIVINSIDKNMYDFQRSQQVQLGGGTISPGEINNPIYHLDGALGVFGSLSRAEYNINVLRFTGL